MKGIYLAVGDTLQEVEKFEDGSQKIVRVQCVAQAGCVGCHFLGVDCSFLLCSRWNRLDGKSVIFSKVEVTERKGGVE